MATPIVLYLIQPTEALRETYLEAMREHQAVDGAPDAGGLTMDDLEGETCLACYTEGLRDGTAMRPGTRPLEGCEWWLVEPGPDGGLVYLGRVSVQAAAGRRYGHVEVAVRPSRRRQGHGARLLRMGLDIARERGVTVARLAVPENNVPARRLVEQAGGTLTGTRRGVRWYSLPSSCSRDPRLQAGASSSATCTP